MNSIQSPSVWREWIEMSSHYLCPGGSTSLPPCGGSGLKCGRLGTAARQRWSPSVWREWIEMKLTAEKHKHLVVSLRVEGVD